MVDISGFAVFLLHVLCGTVCCFVFLYAYCILTAEGLTECERKFITGLIRHSYLYDNNLGKDALFLDHTSLKVKRIEKVKNYLLLARYWFKRLRMDKIEWPNLPFQIRTTNYRRNYGEIMGINPEKEIMLFHGTQSDNVDHIRRSGFSLQSAKDGLYGKKIYFTDCSQKADQYADDKKNRSSGELVMLLVRVALGKVELYGYKGMDHDSEIGGTAVDRKRFFEFMIWNEAQCFPAYVIYYTRIKTD